MIDIEKLAKRSGLAIADDNWMGDVDMANCVAIAKALIKKAGAVE